MIINKHENPKLTDDFYDALDKIIITEQNIKFFIGILETTNDNNIRNQLAVKIADTKNPLLVESLNKLLCDSKTMNCRGNLLSALSEYDYTPYVDLLVHLMCTDNFEVRERSAYMIYKVIDKLSDEQKKTIVDVVSSEIQEFKERIELFQALIDEILF